MDYFPQRFHQAVVALGSLPSAMVVGETLIFGPAPQDLILYNTLATPPPPIEGA